MPSCLPRWLPGVLLLPLCGCLYTVQRFDDGTTLPPGVTDLSLGLGRTSAWEARCADGSWSETQGENKGRCVAYRSIEGATGNWVMTQEVTDPVRFERKESQQFHASWRLGVRRDWGPFKGVELGWNLEAPTEPATLEFWGKLGLPGFKDSATAHSLTAGWSIGAWADNSWWLQYSLSHGFGTVRPWAGTRLLWQATRLDEVASGTGDRLVSRRRWIGQAFAGASVRLPEAMVLPDWLALEGTWTPSGVGAGLVTRAQERLANPDGLVSLHLGMGWSFAP